MEVSNIHRTGKNSVMNLHVPILQTLIINILVNVLLKLFNSRKSCKIVVLLVHQTFLSVFFPKVLL